MPARKSCPKCKITQRYVTKIEFYWGKKRWVNRCLICDAIIDMDEYEDNRKKD